MNDILDFRPSFIGKAIEPSLRDLIEHFYLKSPGDPSFKPVVDDYIRQLRNQMKLEMAYYALDAIHDSSVAEEANALCEKALKNDEADNRRRPFINQRRRE